MRNVTNRELGRCFSSKPCTSFHALLDHRQGPFEEPKASDHASFARQRWSANKQCPSDEQSTSILPPR